MSKFVENLTLLMKSEGLSTVSGQEVLKISKTQLGKYLLGYYQPSLKNALKICQHFNCSLDFLFGLDDMKNRFGEFSPPDNKQFFLRLSSLLQEKNLSKYSIAKELKFNRNNLTYWEKNGSFPSLDLLQILATRLSVPIEFLIGRTPHK